MSAFEPLTGGCLCGKVRFEVREKATDLYHCHCSMCRKVHGASYATYAVAPRSGFSFTQGGESLSRFDSSPGVTRNFCPNCGCQVTVDVAAVPDSIWFPPGIVDGGRHPGAADRERHIYVDSKLPWLHLDEALPRRDVT